MLPTVPTDSLYKFVALLSTATLFTLIFILPSTLLSSFKEKQYDFLQKAAVIRAESDATGKTVQRVKSTIDNYFKEMRGEKTDSDKFPLFFSDTEIKQMMSNADLAMAKLAILTAELEIVNRQSEDIAADFIRYDRLANTGIIVSTILALWGYFNWYKIQRAIDREIFKKA